MLAFFLFFLLLCSLVLNYAFYLELKRLTETVNSGNKRSLNSKNASKNWDTLEKSSSQIQILETSTKMADFTTFIVEELPWKLPGLISDQTPKTAFSRSEMQYPPILNSFTSSEILNESPNILVHWLNRSQNGLLFVKNPELPLFLLNSVLFDVESSEKQLMFGFYFSSLNAYVQFIVDADDSIQIKQGLQAILKNFFLELKIVSQSFEKELSLASDLNTKALIFTFLSGYNINNYDFPVMNKFLQTDPAISNPILECRTLIKELLSIRDRTDFASFSDILSGFFFVDLFWRTGGRLKDWVGILNQSGEFKTLNVKKWEQPKSGRVDVIDQYNWLVYNRNDLLATHFLGIFQNNYLNYILQRFAYAKSTNSPLGLVVLFRQRFLK